MKSKARELVYTDLIGREMYAKHKSLPTWREFLHLGVVIDETKHTLRIRSDGKIRTFVKNQYIFQCWIVDGGQEFLVEFDGNKIHGRPEQRIKLIRKKFRSKLH